MHISGMSGNEIYCLRRKGLWPGEIAVGNSVCSLGLAGAIGSLGRSVAGGEIQQVTKLISDGRHAAIGRMEEEARASGGVGVTGVETTLRTMAGYTEFLAQGTAVLAEPSSAEFFSSAASGIELYCHLDAGYEPRRFVMGNIAYALGIGRGLTGTLRTLARGEVREFSSMYNEIRHTALTRLRREAAEAGANAVVDVQLRMLPYGPGTVELLLTGTASRHPGLSDGPVPERQVVTSELSGPELWNLAKLDLCPHQLVMATSVYSLGVAGGLGALFRSIQRGELPEVTRLIYEARENCLDLIRREAEQLGADQVIGNRLMIREIGQGLVEVVALGTAVRRAPPGMEPRSPELIPQAVVAERGGRADDESINGLMPAIAPMDRARNLTTGAGSRLLGLVLAFFFVMITVCAGVLPALIGAGE